MNIRSLRTGGFRRRRVSSHRTGSTSAQTASEMRRRHAMIVLRKRLSVENLSISLELVNTVWFFGELSDGETFRHSRHLPSVMPAAPSCHSRKFQAGIHLSIIQGRAGGKRKDTAGCPITTVGHDREGGRPFRPPITTVEGRHSRCPSPVIPASFKRESIFP